jgi:hypothetical protein
LLPLIRPELLTGIEEGRQETGFGVGCFRVQPFSRVTSRTRQGEIPQRRFAAGVDRQYMIDWKGGDLQVLGEPTVFAALASALDDRGAEFRPDECHG